jgi:dTDP-4-amino-4,6-dideoxygalactose transaminase
LFAEYGLAGKVGLPSAGRGMRHVWNQYVIRIPNERRDALRAFLAERQIGTEIYYPVPLHMQQCFRELGYRMGSLPHSERAAAETLALPIFAELTASEQEIVVRAIAEFMGRAA